MAASINSKIVADKLGMDHRAFIRHLCDMVTAGTLDKDVLPQRDGSLAYEKDTRLRVGDLMALAVHLNLKKAQCDSIGAVFNRIQPAVPLVRTYVDHTELRASVGSQMGFVAAIEKLADGTGERREIVKEFGLRKVGDRIWLGMSTPAMVGLAQRAGVETASLGQMFCAIDGAERHGTKSFGGHSSKVVSVQADLLLEALVGSAEERLF
ncbi:hypothetical protein FHR70_000676 [Microvirga lupini]|uniref:Uncharacterized protein n=1 Tax=Microvirga lupini TaxID=420324 RepID=A0A7W4VI52_9HYPH|nr:hypothetical protein [Microvirga lupini]MBB3017636.1 hypothetical protein [Microvirga lupini]